MKRTLPRILLTSLFLISCDKLEKAPPVRPIEPENQSYKPRQIKELGSDVASISAGDAHTCATMKDGKVFCWGANTRQQLGSNNVTHSKVPLEVKGIVASTEPYALATSEYNTCAVTSVKTATFCWGDNKYWQLGNKDETTAMSYSPVKVELPDSAASAPIDSLVGNHLRTCAQIGTEAYCWGYVDSRALKMEGGEETSYHKLPDKTHPILMGPLENDPIKTQKWNVLEGLVLLETNTCAFFPELKNPISCLDKDPEIGEMGKINLITAEIARNQGVSGEGAADMKTNRQNEFTSGADHACVIGGKDINEVWCWGENSVGQLGQANKSFSKSLVRVKGLPGQRIDKITSSNAHTCALTMEGLAWCWGSNENGQIGSRMGDPNGPALTAEKVEKLTNIMDMTAGGDHTCALLRDHTAWCWGSNKYGQIGSDI